jgi:hypothetical protein
MTRFCLFAAQWPGTKFVDIINVRDSKLRDVKDVRC